jgi:hypothetical protein
MSGMSTPVNSIPLKTSQNMHTDDDSNDPLVQDVLNEFKREITHQQAPPQQPHQISYQQPHIINNNPPQINLDIHKPPNTITNDDGYFNIELIKKSLYITLIVSVLFYPELFSKIISNILPVNLLPIISQYEFFIITFIIFIALYAAFFYKLL